MLKMPFGVLLGAVLGIVALIFCSNYHPQLVNPITSLYFILISSWTAIIGFQAAAKKAFPKSRRRVVGFVALGSLSVVIAEIIWSNYSYIRNVRPFPSAADIFYLLAFPLFFSSILSLPRAVLNRRQSVLLSVDRGIILLVFGVYLWHLVMAEMLAKAGSFGSLVMMAYPMGDLLILMGLVSVIQRGMKGVGRSVLIFLCGGIILQIIGDTVFAVGMALPVPMEFLAVKIIYFIGRCSILAAVILLTRPAVFKTDQDENLSPTLRNGLLYAAVFAAVVLALWALVESRISNSRLFVTLCGTLGVAMLVLLRQYFVMRDNRSLYAEMEQLALTDALTGLPNRRNFDESLEREIVRALRYDRPLSLLLIDVDQFKQYNDRYGHPAGDALLQNIARLLKTQLRSTDMVGRMGGDEFVVILPETDGKMSGIVVEKLRYVVQAGYMSENGIGISVGCATLQPKMSAGVLLELADKAMYMDKSNKQMVR